MNDVIISRLVGGLGNQMFQYAQGRALALRLGLPHRLDISAFADYGLHHGYELDRIFVCHPKLTDSAEIISTLGWRARLLRWPSLLRSGLRPLHGPRLVVEPYFHYWDGIERMQGSVYLHGYWQSERYFADAADVIRADFVFCQPLSGGNAALAAKLDSESAISLHIRRGDYVTDAKTSAVLRLCSLDYYRAAARYLAQRIVDPEFFVFSDDIPWARKNLDLGFPCHFIDQNCGAESYRDMQLMSHCRHHVLANSSFSWWGAWLNPRPEKIVIGPARWFSNEYSIADLLPKSWVRL